MIETSHEAKLFFSHVCRAYPPPVKAAELSASIRAQSKKEALGQAQLAVGVAVVLLAVATASTVGVMGGGGVSRAPIVYGIVALALLFFVGRACVKYGASRAEANAAQQRADEVLLTEARAAEERMSAGNFLYGREQVAYADWCHRHR
jgi:hypothetical protein